MIELTFLKELILIKQVLQKSAIFITIGIFFNKGFKFQTYVCNRCHDLSRMSIDLNDIIILRIKNSDYRCIITGISKSEAIKLLQNIDLTEKVEYYKNFLKINMKSNSEA